MSIVSALCRTYGDSGRGVCDVYEVPYFKYCCGLRLFIFGCSSIYLTTIRP